MSLRRSEAAAKSRHVVKSSSYRSQGEDGDHGDDDEAWELRERSVRTRRRRLLVLRRRKKRAGPRPAQLAAAGDAAAVSGQGATPSQIRVGRLGACGLRVVAFSDIDTLPLLSTAKYGPFYREQPSLLVQIPALPRLISRARFHHCQSTSPARNFLTLTHGLPTFSPTIHPSFRAWN